LKVFVKINVSASRHLHTAILQINFQIILEYDNRNFPSAFYHCWLGNSKGIRPEKNVGCWFLDGDDLTGALHVLQLQLSPSPPSSLAPLKFRMETFWYRLTVASTRL